MDPIKVRFRLSLVCGALFALCASAASAPLASAILSRIAQLKKVPPHAGLKEAFFYKNGHEYHSLTKVFYASPFRFKFVSVTPSIFEGNVLVANGRDIITYLPHQKIKFKLKLNKNMDIRVDHGEQNLYLNVVLKKLKKHYKIKVVGQQKVAGRLADVLLITNGTRTRKIWVDRQRHFILKEKRLYGRKLTYQMRYKTIAFRRPTTAELSSKLPKVALPVPPFKDSFYSSYRKAKKLYPYLSPLPPLPKKFAFEFVQHSKSIAGDFLLISTTDGLTDIRITQEKSGAMRKLMEKFFGRKAKQMQQAIILYSPITFVTKENADGKGMRLTVSGEFPPSYLKKLLRRLSP